MRDPGDMREPGEIYYAGLHIDICLWPAVQEMYVYGPVQTWELTDDRSIQLTGERILVVLASFDGWEYVLASDGVGFR